MIELRPYQRRAVAELYRVILEGKRRVVLCCPTGGGKTIIAAVIMRDAVARGRRVLFLAHRIELVDQCQKKLAEMGIEGVTVTTAQSLLVETRTLPHADVIILDECHAQHGNKILDLYRADSPIVIGLTATPVRATGRPLGAEYEAMVIAARYSELIEAGAILAPVAWAPSIPQLTAKEKAGDYDINELCEEMSKPSVIGDIVGNWKERGAGEQTICFAVNKAHANQLRDAFREAGVVCESVFGDTPAAKREIIIRRFRQGEFPVIVSVGVLVEGFDVPEIRNVILARPTKSLVVYLQSCGRACRPASNKTTYRIFDHSGAILTHGLPSTDRGWSIEKKPPRPDAIRVGMRICPNMHVFESGPRCPHCGEAPPGKSRPVRIQDGKLEEVDAEYEKQALFAASMKRRSDFRRHLYIRGKKGGLSGDRLRSFVERKMVDFK